MNLAASSNPNELEIEKEEKKGYRFVWLMKARFEIGTQLETIE